MQRCWSGCDVSVAVASTRFDTSLGIVFICNWDTGTGMLDEQRRNLDNMRIRVMTVIRIDYWIEWIIRTNRQWKSQYDCERLNFKRRNECKNVVCWTKKKFYFCGIVWQWAKFLSNFVAMSFSILFSSAWSLVMNRLGDLFVIIMQEAVNLSLFFFASK